MAPPTNGHEAPNPERLLLVSVPRTASNLLLKVLNVHQQPNLLTNKTGGYFFHEAYTTAAAEIKKPFSQWTDAEKTRIRDIYQRCLENLEEYSERARREGKVMFAKEHAFWLFNPDMAAANNDAPPSTFRLTFPPATYGPPDQQTFSRTNHTLFPDAYLRTWQLAFIIRHPALAWPSLYRAILKMTAIGMLDDDGVRGASLANMSLAPTRMLFDWCVEENKDKGGNKVPPVIDANEVIHSPGAVRRFCEAVGMDEGMVRFEWEEADLKVKEKEKEKEEGKEGEKKEPAFRETWDPAGQAAAKIMLSTLVASKGIVKDKAPATVDIKAEAAKWRDEFGEEVAGIIEKAVWDAMPDYEYLRERSVQA